MGNTEDNTYIHNEKFFQIVQFGYCKVWVRKQDNTQQMEQYTIIAQENKLLTQYNQMYQLRTNSEYYVNIYYFTYQSEKQLCSGFLKGFLLTQRIPFRISQCCQIPLSLSLNIILKALQVYKKLKQIYGYFLINSNMLGVNNEWKLKFWIHTDLSQPYPENPFCKSNSQMIKSIIGSIQKSTIKSHKFCSLTQFLNYPTNRHYYESFQKTMLGIHQYLRYYSIQLIDNLNQLKSIIKIIDDDNQQSNHTNQNQLKQINNKFSFRNLYQKKSSLSLSSTSQKPITTRQTTDIITNFDKTPKFGLFLKNEDQYLKNPRYFPISNKYQRDKSKKLSFSNPKCYRKQLSNNKKYIDKDQTPIQRLKQIQTQYYGQRYLRPKSPKIKGFNLIRHSSVRTSNRYY